MLSVFLKKIKESLVSVVPIVAIVFVLNLTPLVNFTNEEIIAFLVSAVFLIVGISLFNQGADLAMTPIGEHIGSGLSKLKSLALLISVCFLMGILITVAEPDLTVLANQVSAIIDGTVLILTVGIGVGLFLAIAVMKIVFRKPLSSMLMFFYLLLFAFSAILIELGGRSLIPLSFDSGGVTTGPITVPFIMALGVGIASTIGGKNAGENSFGLIALCSVGPMLAVLILGCTASGSMSDVVPDYVLNTGFGHILHTLLETAKEVVLALGLIVIFFVILQLLVLKLPKKRLIQITFGILYTFAGLVLFLSAVKIGFMPIGYKLGVEMSDNPVFLAVFSFVIGLVVVLAEPAVHVLNRQVEDITEGTVSRKSMMIALSIGVGLSICLSIIRIIFNFSILYYLIPGYAISLGLSFFVPGLYTAIAFDSGGVASGPLTSSFILPFAVGACYALQGSEGILTNAFGVVAMVAMAPLITIQLLGFRAVLSKHINDRIATRRILDADDEQIINFM
ncbi:MAG: DUF1538 domain-containing protein [Clostridia bacterium]|nr:DUF1538 domain-containing protein [Clostridia bacterium]